MTVSIEVNQEHQRIDVDAPRTFYDDVRKVPGSSYVSREDCWTIPLTWPSCVIMRGLFQQDLVVGPELTKWARHEMGTRISPILDLKSKDIPDAVDTFPEYEGEEFSLYDYQRPAAQFLATARFALLGDDMRVGKTPTAIRALRHLHDIGEDVLPALVVCPPNVKRVWKEKFEQFWPGISVAVPKSGVAAAEKAVMGDADIVVLHYEILPLISNIEGWGAEALKPCKECNPESDVQVSRCHIHKKVGNQKHWKTVIADEVHRVGAPQAIMTRALWRLSHNSNIRWGLTGTPPEDPDRLWSVMHFICPEEYPGKGKWIDRYVDTEINPWSGFPESIGFNSLRRPEWNKFFLPRFMRRPREVVHDVIPPEVVMLEPEMTPKQAKAYKDLKASMMAEIEGGLFWVDSPGAKMIRLRQLASAYGELQEDGGLKLSEPSSKLDAMEDKFTDLPPNTQVAIFAEQRQLLDLAKERLGDKAVMLVGGMSDMQRTRSVEKFETGEAQYILCTTSSGGEGISLASADTTMFLQRPYSFKDSEQSKVRMYEEGKATLIIDMQTPDTVDSRVFETLERKGLRFEELVQDRETVIGWLK